MDLARDRFDEAIKEYKEAVRINPNLIDKDRIYEAMNEAIRTQAKRVVKISGGDGFSMSNAIIISDCNDPEGVLQEYIELRKRFGQYKKIRRRLLEDNNRKYDVFELDINGEKVEVYFDITNFFGKL